MFPAVRLIVCTLFAAASSLGAAATANNPPQSMEQALILRVDGDLTIDAQGVPVDYRIKTALPPKLSDRLLQHVHAWRFEPVLVDGKAVLAHSEMRVILAAQGTGDDYRVTVDGVTFPQTRGQTGDASESLQGPTTISYANKPNISYPKAALIYGLEAKVMVDVRLTSDGRVDQAIVEQTALFNVKGKPEDLRAAAELFEREVLASVKSWRFNVVVNVPQPTAEDLTIRVPVQFSVQGSPVDRDKGAGWRQEVRTPAHRAPWLLPSRNTQSMGVADLADGELAPAGSRFQLTAPVVGSAL